MRAFYTHPSNPLAHTHMGRALAASAEMFERSTRRFGKPEFRINSTTIAGKAVPVTEKILVEKPFCNLLHFERQTKRKDPKVLIVAPMSGHFATLLRGTVNAMLPHHDVYITDWLDARVVPIEDGVFDLDTYISYLIEFYEHLGEDFHVIAVCQPAVPVFASAVHLETIKSKHHPDSIILMGGPIDTRISKTQVNELAEEKDLSWFEDNVTMNVPLYYPGAMRKVYPGFIQLGGFMSMNLDTHVDKHMKFYQHLLIGDGESADAHRKFYNEYLSVMDISADFYLQTVDVVFQRHCLPKGEMVYTDPATEKEHAINPAKIKKTAILTIEGEKDDISSLGQTTAVHTITTGLEANKKFHHLQQNVGHYGIFNGRRWREFIMPRVANFIRSFDENSSPIPPHDKKAYANLKVEKWDPSIHAPEVALKHLAELKEKGAEKGKKKTE
jgi:poly(3-hydroxybutyrate) depolymerase